MKRDEESVGFFLTRCFYLFRKFLLLFKDARVNIDQVTDLINRRRHGAHNHHNQLKDDQMSIYKRLRLNFVTMNVCLTLLYQFEGKEGEQKLRDKIYEFIMHELPHRDSTNYHKYSHLIPLSYVLMKKIVTSCVDNNQKQKLLKDISDKAGESVKIIVQQPQMRNDRSSTNAGIILSIYVAILQLKIIFEIDNSLLEPHLDDLYQ